jgi:CheY-like chemotaxis protein
VLLVEDDELNLELLQAVLEAAGYEVLSASDAQAGIALARRAQPDAILMDLQMPDMDGLEATHILRADPSTSNIPVIAVTAHVKPEDRELCLAAGCRLHLPKPFDTRALPDLVAGVIEAAGGEGMVRDDAVRDDAVRDAADPDAAFDDTHPGAAGGYPGAPGKQGKLPAGDAEVARGRAR